MSSTHFKVHKATRKNVFTLIFTLVVSAEWINHFITIPSIQRYLILRGCKKHRGHHMNRNLQYRLCIHGAYIARLPSDEEILLIFKI